jgi:hypothetical protein
MVNRVDTWSLVERYLTKLRVIQRRGKEMTKRRMEEVWEKK